MQHKATFGDTVLNKIFKQIYHFLGAMNRYFEEEVEKAWQSLSPELRIIIQREMGFDRNEVSAEELTNFTVEYLKKKLDELKWDKLKKDFEEKIGNLGEDLEERTINYLTSLRQETIDSLKEIANVLGERHKEILHQIEETK